jgi:hypothetical protein
MSVERAQEVVSAVGALRQVPDSPAEVRQRAILSCVRPQSSRPCRRRRWSFRR